MAIHDDGPTGLCAELRTILENELTAGNRIKRVDNDAPGAWPLVVLLLGPFRCRPDPLPDSLRYLEIDSRALWKSHFVHLATGQILACLFGDEMLAAG
jgi:hypothetical protein